MGHHVVSHFTIRDLCRHCPKRCTHRWVDFNHAGGCNYPTRPGSTEFIGGRLRGLQEALTIERKFFQEQAVRGNVNIGCLFGCPRQAHGLAAVDLLLVEKHVGGDGSDSDGGAAGARVKAFHLFHTGCGFPRQVSPCACFLRNVDDEPLVLMDVYFARPERLRLPGMHDKHLVCSHRDDQLLRSPDGVVHLVNMTDKILGGCAVEKNSRRVVGVTFDLNTTPWTRYPVWNRRQAGMDGWIVASDETDFFYLGDKTIVVDAKGVLAWSQIECFAPMIVGMAINEDVSLFRADRHLDFGCARLLGRREPGNDNKECHKS